MKAPWARRAVILTSCMIIAAGMCAMPATAAAGRPTHAVKRLAAKSLSASSTSASPKSVSGRMAESDPALLKRTDSASVNVMVKLDYDAAASYAGDLPGYPATSPHVTGKPLSKSDPDVARYLSHADAQSAAAARDIRAAHPQATVGAAFNVAYGGLSVRLPANQAKSLLSVPGVVAVQLDAVDHPSATSGSASTASSTMANDTTSFVGADKVWPSLGGPVKAGEGVIVADLDTGIWPEHPMLKDLGIPRPRPVSKKFGCEFGNGSDPDLGPSFTCNDKLVGAYAFLDTALSLGVVEQGEYCDIHAGACSARDSDGHGTHTSTTAAGDGVQHATLLGIDRGPVSGLAPGASVIEYRVCVLAGCYKSDSVAAVQQAILDGVDVINFSIGGGENPYSDPVELAFLDAYKAGVSVSASAGNEGPDAGTAGHAGPWVISVGAVTPDRAFTSTLQLRSTDGATFSKRGATITTGVTSKPVVQAAKVPGYTGTKNCLAPFAAGSLTGKVVVCERGGGGGGRAEKGYFASQGGAAGMILYNPTNMGDIETDNHFLPAIHLEGPGDALLAFLGAHPGIKASWTTGQAAPAQGDVLAGFSSRGPIGDFLKPDIVAPGVQILAGHTPNSLDLVTGPRGQLFQAIAGTSMASPHSAGIAALVKASHPGWTPGQIKSALMTSSVQDVVTADGSAATPRDRGAGSIRADRAVAPSLTFDVRPSDYLASAADALDRIDLNVPSIKANPLPGAVVTHRWATNVSGQQQTFDATSSAGSGLRIRVTPSTFTLKAGATQKLTVLLDGIDAKGAQAFGQVTLRPRTASATPVVLPVEAVIGQAQVTLAHACNRGSLAPNQTTHCTVTARNDTPVQTTAKIEVGSDGMTLSHITTPAHGNGDLASWSGTLTGAKAPTIDSIEPTGVTDGYLPLSSFDIPGQPDVGDESILNFDVEPFKYGAETYTSLGVGSNGYLVVGGGTVDDIRASAGAALPDPMRPNNVIAPYWTDLDPSAGGAIRVATVSDDTSGTSWIVVDYDAVRDYGSTKTNTFEVWLQTGDTEGQWIDYGTLHGPNGQPLTVGAENRDGTSGVNVAPTKLAPEYFIATSPPVPGGSVTFGYQASSAKPGSYSLYAGLTSPLVKGYPIKRVPITVHN